MHSGEGGRDDGRRGVEGMGREKRGGRVRLKEEEQRTGREEAGWMESEMDKEEDCRSLS